MTTINPYSDEMLIDPCINDSEEVIKNNVTKGSIFDIDHLIEVCKENNSVKCLKILEEAKKKEECNIIFMSLYLFWIELVLTFNISSDRVNTIGKYYSRIGTVIIIRNMLKEL